ncbi:MAG: PLP-dependent aminotransferase family protein [Paracoccaceae bacterium]|nr:PLP-dependent aminotransferase family protein [Paracoccaceae bacterium]
MPKFPGGTLLSSFNIDRSSRIPIYRQIDAFLRRLILKGVLVPKQKLPSSRELAMKLGVSRITVKSVYEQLVAEGYAQARTGAGTFISEGLDFESTPKIACNQLTTRVDNFKISTRAQSIMSSKASVRHGATAAFRPGVPALDLFPVKLWNKYWLDAMNCDELNNMSYGQINGSSTLRKSIAHHLTDAREVQVDPDQIVVTSGAQQAFVLIAFILLNRRDTIWYENPGHIAGRDVIQLMGANVAPIPIDNEGLDLNFAAKMHPKPTLIFTTPSHQQPLGTTMSLARRLALLKYAHENVSWIIEDDYDSEFRYRGRPLPALSALDRERRVFYVGTFSKSLFSAMRMGYIVVPPWLVDTFAKARNLLGQSSSPVVEQALSRFIDDGRLVEHIRKMRRIYRERRDTLLDCISSTCTDCLTPQKTDAGMHILALLKNNVDDNRAHRALLDAGIESLPLSVYCIEPINCSALVLGFSGVPKKRMPSLVHRMGKALRSIP